ncbi:MAG: fibronectin type III domain-containing protein [Eubacterium sp.]|nr:fibronectin type III domain-containing protein [Eubacterium sp.]
MKKILSIVSLVFLLAVVSAMPIFAAETKTTIKVSEVIAEPEETVEVLVDISNNTGVLGVTLSVSYADNLELESVTKGNALAQLTMTKPGDLSSNPVNIVWDGEAESDKSNGTIAILKFKAPKEIGNYPIVITYSPGAIVDDNLQPVEVETIAGSVTVQSEEIDKTAVQKVTDKINAMDPNDEDAVKDARDAYDGLTDDQKKLIKPEDYKKLTDAEEAIQKAKEKAEADQAAADAAIQAINGINENDKASVEAAREAYEALTEAQKKLVSAEILKKLTDAEQAIQEAEDQEKQDKEAAEAVCELIRMLPDQAEIKYEASVAEARNKYNALSEAQKKLVSNELVSKLEEAEKQIEEAKAEAQKTEEEKKADEIAAAIASGKIDALPDPVTIAYEQDILEVRETYDKLTEAQKKLVTKEKTDKLVLAETQMEEIKTSMETGQGAALTEEEINKAKEEKEAADKLAAENVEKQLNELSDNVKLEDEEIVTQARISYEILSNAQKGLVPEDAVTKLDKAEKQIETAKNNNSSGKDNAGTGNVNGQGTSGGSVGGGTQVTKQQTGNSAAYNKAVAAAKKLKVKGLKVKAQKKRKAKVSWKVNKKASGYQIQYSTNKKFKKANKIVNIKNSKKKNATIKKLKAGKIYYVRIRPYVTVKDANGSKQTVYGKWSKAKRIRSSK